MTARALLLVLALAAADACAQAPPADLPPGARWSPTAAPASTRKQDDIFFIDPERGWYVNGAGEIRATSDGGATWTLLVEQPGTYFRALAFLDDRNGLAGNIGPGYFPGVTDPVPLYRTRDGGTTWTPVKLPASVPGLCAIDVVRDDAAVAIHAGGRVGGPAWLLRSLDAGATWSVIDLNARAAMILDVHFFDVANGIVCAATDANLGESQALILATSDGGVTWQERYRSARPFETTWKASFPTRETGYVTIQSYDPDQKNTKRYLAKTEDGGVTWWEIALVDDHEVREFGVAFASERIGWVGTSTGGFQTTDGGVTWTRVEMGRYANKIRIVPAKDGFVAYAVGREVHKLDARR